MLMWIIIKIAVKEIKQFYIQSKMNIFQSIKVAQYKTQTRQLSGHAHMIIFKLKEMIFIKTLNK